MLERFLDSGQLPSVGQLLSLDRNSSYRPDSMRLSYAYSAAFIKYLQDGEDGGLAEGFHIFLQPVAAGRRADLLKILERDVEEVDRGFRRWFEQEARENREKLHQRAIKVVLRDVEPTS